MKYVIFKMKYTSFFDYNFFIVKIDFKFEECFGFLF